MRGERGPGEGGVSEGEGSRVREGGGGRGV